MLRIEWTRVKSRVNLDEQVLHIVKKNNAYLGGGCFRGIFGKDEIVADYDVFFHNAYDAATMALDLEEAEYEVVFKCPQGLLTTLKKNDIKVQLITEFFYNSGDQLINTFDLHACRFVLTPVDVLITDRNAIRAVRRKHITFNVVDFPVATFKRILKYIQKGYTIPNESIDKYVSGIYNKGISGDLLNTRVYID